MLKSDTPDFTSSYKHKPRKARYKLRNLVSDGYLHNSTESNRFEISAISVERQRLSADAIHSMETEASLFTPAWIIYADRAGDC